MRIGILSDTHDRLEALATALEFFAEQGVGLVVHCGDWKSLVTVVFLAEKAAALQLPVRGVLGNNDTDVSGFLQYGAVAPGDFMLAEGVMDVAAGGLRLGIYHGHHKPSLRKLRTDSKYSVLCLGHTHKPLIEQLDSKLIVNPGSTAFAIPRSKSWQRTVALVDTSTRTAEIIRIPK